jgi:putative intracellular protease/amidase
MVWALKLSAARARFDQKLVSHTPQVHIHDLIIAAVDEHCADYLVIYASGTHGRENSKHTLALIEGADANIVVCNR